MDLYRLKDAVVQVSPTTVDAAAAAAGSASAASATSDNDVLEKKQKEQEEDDDSVDKQQQQQQQQLQMKLNTILNLPHVFRNCTYTCIYCIECCVFVRAAVCVGWLVSM